MSAFRLLPIAACLALLTACGTTPPPEFNGKWRPVNRFASDTQAIPLSPTYTYYAAPLDATLRGVLMRWSADNGLVLSYQLDTDYTLHQPVSRIRTTSLQDALAELNAIYRAQGLEVLHEGRALLVRPRVAEAVAEGNE